MFNTLSAARVRFVLLLLLVAVIAAVYLQFLFRKAATARLAKRPGAAAFDTPDTKGTVPGHPERSEQQMRQLFQSVRVFRRIHRRFPRGASELLSDMDQNMEYPYGSDVLLNKDCRYSDMAPLRRSSRCMPYMISARRPDGTSLGAARPAGTRDVVAMTPIYFHWNFKNPARGAGSMRPVGFFLVLWDDGN